MGVSENGVSAKKFNPELQPSSPSEASLPTWDESMLVTEVKNGNQRAFAEIVRRHQVGLMRLSLRMTKDWDAAEDIVQDSFIKAYQKINSFEGRSTFKSWLFQICLNTAKNKLRSTRNHHINVDNLGLNTQSKVDKTMAINDLKQAVQEAISRLPNRQKTALVLRIYEDLSFKEIAYVMQCPYDTAKANYRHALLKLKESIKAEQFVSYFQDFQQIDEIEVGFIHGEINK